MGYKIYNVPLTKAKMGQISRPGTPCSEHSGPWGSACHPWSMENVSLWSTRNFIFTGVGKGLCQVFVFP